MRVDDVAAVGLHIRLQSHHRIPFTSGNEFLRRVWMKRRGGKYLAGLALRPEHARDGAELGHDGWVCDSLIEVDAPGAGAYTGSLFSST